MTRFLVAASVAWPLMLGAGTVAQVRSPGHPVAIVMYVAGSAVCHQIDQRSFHTHGTKWAVCARCSGLYLAAPFGALAAFAGRRRLSRTRDLRMLALAAVPTAVTFVAEHGGVANISSMERFVAALPLGAAIAWVVVRAARGPETCIE